MTTVSGRLLDFVEDPSNVAEVSVRAQEVHPHGDGLMLDHPVNVEWDPRTGTVTFDAAAGTAGVIMWHAVGRSHASGSLPIVVPEGDAATLRECVEAVMLADEGTISALERLALEVTGMVATIQNIALLETWADTARREAAEAREDADRAEEARGASEQIATNLPATIDAELDTRVPPLVEPMVPPLVADAIADDRAVADAAAAAVGAAADAIKWYQGGIPAGTDMNTLTKNGYYAATTWSVIRTLTNRPSGLPGDWSQPARITVYTSGARVQQEWRTLPAQGVPSVFASRVYSNYVWSEWEADEETTQIATTGMDLDNLSGTFSMEIQTYAVAASLIGRPSAIPDAVGAAFFHQSETPSGHKVQEWTRILSDPSEPLIAYRTKGRSGSAFTQWKSVLPESSAGWSRTGAIHFWGDSGVAAGLAGDLASNVSNPVFNQGKWGWETSSILVKAGIRQFWGTPVTGEIPASGSVDIDMHGQTLNEDVWRAWQVTYAGIPGTLHHEAGGRFRFQRSADGTAKAVTSMAPFVSTSVTEAGTHIFLMGGNDWANRGAGDDTVGQVLAAYAQAVDAIPAAVEKHVLIAGVKTRAATVPGDENHIFVQEVNRRLAEMFPQYFVHRQAWLVENGLRSAGLAPNADDEALMVEGIIPPACFSDHTHLLRSIDAVEARELWAPELRARGWAY